jgi:hypothetical protein
MMNEVPYKKGLLYRVFQFETLPLGPKPIPHLRYIGQHAPAVGYKFDLQISV